MPRKSNNSTGNNSGGGRRGRKPGDGGGMRTAGQAFLAEYKRTNDSLKTALYALKRTMDGLRFAQAGANAVVRAAAGPQAVVNQAVAQPEAGIHAGALQTAPAAVEKSQAMAISSGSGDAADKAISATQAVSGLIGSYAALKAAQNPSATVSFFAMISRAAMACGAAVLRIAPILARVGIALLPFIPLVGQVVAIGAAIYAAYAILGDTLGFVAVMAGVLLAVLINPALAVPITIVGAIVVGFKALMAILSVVKIAWNAFASVVKLSFDVLLAVPRLIFGAFKLIPGAIASTYRGLKSAVVGTYEAIVSGIQKAFSALVAAVKASFAFLVRAITDPSRTLLQPLVNAVAGAVNLIGRSFAKVGEWIDAAAQKLGSMGSALSGWANQITGPMTSAAEKFAELGADAAKLAEQAGLSVKSLTELAYAAKQFGASGSDVASASGSANRLFAKAAGGDAEAASTFEQIGIAPKVLERMPSEQRFIAIGQALAKITDEAERSKLAMAVFGSAGEKLLPMLAKGEAGLAQWRQEAERAGLVLTGPAAEAAKALTSTYERLKDSIAGFWLQIGSIVAPIITETTETIARAVQIATRWVTQNREVIATAFKIASAIGTAGAVLTTLGGILGGGATIASVIAGALGSVATAVTVIGGVVVAVLSPIGLLIAGLAAAGVYLSSLAPIAQGFAAAADVGSRAWGSLGSSVSNAAGKAMQVLGQMRDFAGQVMGGIEAAIRAGDLEQAIAVLWAGAQTAWANGLHAIATLSDGAFGGVLNLLAAGKWSEAAGLASDAIELAFSIASRDVKDIWVGVQDVFDSVATNIEKTFGRITQTILRMLHTTIGKMTGAMDWLSKFDPTEKTIAAANALARLQWDIGDHIQTQDQQSSAEQKANEGLATRKEQRTTERATERTKENQRITELGLNVSGGITTGKSSAEDAIRDTEERLRREIAEAEKLKLQMGLKPDKAKAEPGKSDKIGWQWEPSKSSRTGFSAAEEQGRNISKPEFGERIQVGTFSAAAFMAMSNGQGQGGGPMEKIAKSAEEQKDLLRKVVDENMKLNQRLDVFAQGMVG